MYGPDDFIRMNRARIWREGEDYKIWEMKQNPSLLLLRHIAYVTHNANTEEQSRVHSASDLLRLPGDPPPIDKETIQSNVRALKERARKRGKKV